MAVSGNLDPGAHSVSGQRESGNGFIVNGGNAEDRLYNNTAIIPNLDSIAEFRILTNNADAEYGSYTGGLVNVVTKQGTNQFHGDAFEFVRNPHLDSRYFYSPSRATLHQNIFGGTFGGPVKHDRLFFFTDYQGTRLVQGEDTGLIPVPSAQDRTGNLSDVASLLTKAVSGDAWASTLSQRLGYTVTNGEPYYTSGCTSSSQCVFPNAVIPQSAISPPAQFQRSTSRSPTRARTTPPQPLRERSGTTRAAAESMPTLVWVWFQATISSTMTSRSIRTARTISRDSPMVLTVGHKS